MTRTRIGRRLWLGVSLSLAMMGLVRPSAAAADIVVINTNDSGNGSLRQAIVDAASGETITFALDLASCPCTIALTSGLGELVIDKNLTIVGPGPNALTVSGEGVSRVFRIALGVVADLQGLAVRNGNGAGGGPYGGSGGGILNEGTLSLLNVIVADNSAADHLGGGIYSSPRSSLTVRNSVFTLNRAAHGGGIGSDGSLFMSGSTLTSNAAEGGLGGGVDARAGGTIIGSTISGNDAIFPGGGVSVPDGSLTLVNCTISGNSAPSGTAAAVADNAILSLFSTTVTANEAADATGGALSVRPRGQLVLNNSIVAGNSPVDIDNLGKLIGGNNLVGGDAAAILDARLADNGGPTLTHALVPNSPALDLGSNGNRPRDRFDLDGDGDTTELVPIDQRGFVRVFGAGIDIGAFEVVCSAVAVTPAVLPAGRVGVAYSEQLVARGGAGAYAFSAIGLPPGLTLSPHGVLSGTPSTGGTATLTVTVTDGFGCGSTEVAYTLTIADPGCGIDVGPAMLATPYVATLYYQPLPITPAGTYTVRISAGALPTGVYLFAIGRNWFLGGIPATPGEYTFALTATKKDSACARTRAYTVTVPKTVLPQLTCVVKTGSKYTAKFGYDNSTGEVVTIPVGPDNLFTPGAQDRHQVTTFQPGRVTNAFSVLFTVKQNRSDLALWYLRGPDGVRRPVNITTATSRCQ